MSENLSSSSGSSSLSSLQSPAFVHNSFGLHTRGHSTPSQSLSPSLSRARSLSTFSHGYDISTDSTQANKEDAIATSRQQPEQLHQDFSNVRQASQDPTHFLGMPPPTQSPFPTFSVPSSYEIYHRVGMLEQEMINLRQGQANLLAEVAQLRRRPAAGTGPISQMDTLKESLLQAIKPTKSLLPGEAPGFDCEREAKQFKQCKFFNDDQWKEYKISKKGITAVGEVIGKRGRKPKGTNAASHAFLENIDGTPADPREYYIARQWAHDMIDMCINLGFDLPGSWMDVDIRIRQMCYDALRAICPLLQMCDDNYKAKIIMSSVFYEDYGRDYNKNAKQVSVASKSKKLMKLDEAPYTIHDPDHPSDAQARAKNKAARDAGDSSELEYADDAGTLASDSDDESSDEGEADSRTHAPKTTHDKREPTTRVSTKRAREEESAPPVVASAVPPKKRKTKATRTPTPGPSPLATPVQTKGKQRAGLADLIEDNSMLMLAQEPIPDLPLPPPQLQPSKPKPTPKAIKKGKAKAVTTEKTNASGDQGQQHSAAARQTPSIEEPRADVSVPSGLATTSAPSAPSATSSRLIAMPPGLPTPSSATTSSTQRPRRKLEAWPPAEDVEGAMWAYAREWFAKTQGTHAEFTKHYSSIPENEKSKYRRMYNSKRASA